MNSSIDNWIRSVSKNSVKSDSTSDLSALLPPGALLINRMICKLIPYFIWFFVANNYPRRNWIRHADLGKVNYRQIITKCCRVSKNWSFKIENLDSSTTAHNKLRVDWNFTLVSDFFFEWLGLSRNCRGKSNQRSPISSWKNWREIQIFPNSTATNKHSPTQSLFASIENRISGKKIN